MVRPSLILALVVASIGAALSPATALQTLIPSPYPSGVSGAAPLDPEPQHPGPQELLRDPYPQILGDDAQGNPPIARRHRHQHLVPTANERKYKVDRPPSARP